MIFEQLIRQDLMAAAKAALPALKLDGTSEPAQAQVFLVARDFDRTNPRSYRVGFGGSPLQMTVAKVTADVTVTAELAIGAEAQIDLEPLLAALLDTHSLLWNWRGNEMRVERTLARTRLADAKTALRESIYVTYTAPYFKLRDLPVIADASWFDDWHYKVEVP